jgi:hypothetical protein
MEDESATQLRFGGLGAEQVTNAATHVRENSSRRCPDRQIGRHNDHFDEYPRTALRSAFYSMSDARRANTSLSDPEAIRAVRSSAPRWLSMNGPIPVRSVEAHR